MFNRKACQMVMGSHLVRALVAHSVSADRPCACYDAGVVDVKSGTGSVELQRYPASHPFAQLQGSDNIIAFTTARYRCSLSIHGPAVLWAA